LAFSDIFQMAGRVAVVTGAANGLGRSFARGLADFGADVICADRDLAGSEETVRLIREAGGSAEAVFCDVSEVQSVEGLFGEVERLKGCVDILINNAGISTGPRRLHELPVEDWDRLMAINLRGVFLCTRAAVLMMLKQQSGSIINISSIAGLGGFYPGLSRLCVNYSASKAGVIGLTKQAAMDYARDGIRINAIAPGWHGGTNLGNARRAAMTQEETRRMEEAVNSRIPMGRRGKPDDLVGLVVYLASDASSYVTGQVIAHDGGWSAD
jgi:NAD(P)-dependent dehydrogenase (short-subunit alcohol dehydrogenase family)